MRVLATFAGFHDPYSHGLVGEEPQAGPIISLVNARAFDHVVLISTSNTQKNTSETESALKSLHPDLGVSTIEASLSDPTDYAEILHELRTKVRPKLEALNSQIDLSVVVAFGTPQMHAVWLLMVASGEMPARILHTSGRHVS